MPSSIIQQSSKLSSGLFRFIFISPFFVYVTGMVEYAETLR